MKYHMRKSLTSPITLGKAETMTALKLGPGKKHCTADSASFHDYCAQITPLLPVLGVTETLAGKLATSA